MGSPSTLLQLIEPARLQTQPGWTLPPTWLARINWLAPEVISPTLALKRRVRVSLPTAMVETQPRDHRSTVINERSNRNYFSTNRNTGGAPYARNVFRST